MADESMSSVQFCTTPKLDLPHYSYILRKTELWGVEINNMDFSRLGAMLHLEIQKGKEAMKTSIFQKYLGGNAVCIKRLTMYPKRCDQLTYNDTYFADIWFSGVNTAEDAIALGSIIAGQ